MSRLEELSVDHPYYCSESNYYSNEAALSYEAMSDFLDEFEYADIDMNLCFRWDIREDLDDEENGTGTYHAEVFLMLQRKGKFMPVRIDSVVEDDCSRFEKYARKHFDRIKQIWKPLV